MLSQFLAVRVFLAQVSPVCSCLGLCVLMKGPAASFTRPAIVFPVCSIVGCIMISRFNDDNLQLDSILSCFQVAANKELRDEHIRALEAEFALHEPANGQSGSDGASPEVNVLGIMRGQNVSILLKGWKMTPKQVTRMQSRGLQRLRCGRWTRVFCGTTISLLCQLVASGCYPVCKPR